MIGLLMMMSRPIVTLPTSGTSSTALPMLTVLASSNVILSGSLTKALPIQTASASATVAISGSLMKSLPMLVRGNISGSVAISGSLTKALPMQTVSAAGSVVAVPDLTSVGRAEVGDGNLCNGNSWIQEVSWVVSNANDSQYQIDIQVATNASGDNWTTLVVGQTTFTSTYNDDTGIAGNLSGFSPPTTEYRKYRVLLVRKSDGATVESMDTDQGQLTYYSDACI